MIFNIRKIDFPHLPQHSRHYENTSKRLPPTESNGRLTNGYFKPARMTNPLRSLMIS